MTKDSPLSSIEEIIDDARNGRMFILVDDEDRENEGDLIIPAQMATPDAVNFMAKYGRGLICLSMTSERIDQLGLSMMSTTNESRHSTAFTVSIEAREGISTGISAADRARTVATAIDPSKSKESIVSPGHVFPLMARDGGVLVRAGHTEAAVDISRLAGLNPSGVICEIMNDDGSMARMPDLLKFSQRHGLRIGTIADLISYRLRYDRLVKRSVSGTLHSAFGGDFQINVYENTVAYAEHIALVKGDISGDEPVLVRMHALNVLDDVLGDKTTNKYSDLQTSMRMIGEAGRGVLVVIREPQRTQLSDRIRGGDEHGAAPRTELRDYGVGAQILLDLGVENMVLLTNTQKVMVGLDGYGLKVQEQRPIPRSESH